MYDKVRFPVSKARAAYWAGRAAERAGDRNAAESWYNTGSAYPTAFYGQLSALKQHGTAPLRIPAAPRITGDEQQRFDQSDLAQAVTIVSRMGRNDLASRLISGMIESAQSADDAAMIAALGKEIGHSFLSVRGAKKALQYHNAVLLKTGYPSPKTPYDAAVERPLLLAITRQESEFDPSAKSPAGALGMMQLLPSTARETAKKYGLGYALPRLYEPDYSWTIGSLYLNRMIDNYNGSYVMAIAAYNAGPGNVRKWVRLFGTPGNDIDKAVKWIEMIPFSETRNYVQRVLENLQLYRYALAEGESPKLKLGEDLAR
jgi:soluble lytic murein transglycosylase